MSQEFAPLKIAVIFGSNRSGRFGTTIGDWFVGEARKNALIDIDVIDLAKVLIPLDLTESGDSEDFRARIGTADGFVVITPEYNHSFPGYLKIAIDSVHAEWKAKPVGFVSYGGVSGGLRAIEALRLVFAEVHAVGLRDAVSFHGAPSQFGEDGQPVDAAAVNRTAAWVLNELIWWANALKTARGTVPYIF